MAEKRTVDIAGKTILITGASQGIGRYLARHFAPRAGCIIVAARREGPLNDTAAAVHQAGGRCLVYPCDLRDPEAVAGLAAFALAETDGVDCLINNAADVFSKPLLETDPSAIDSLLRTNVIGPVDLTRRLVPRMIAQGNGLVINISSLAGYKANPAQTVYSVSKTAVNGFSEALRAELRGTGVNVMNVALSSVAVDGPPQGGQIPVERFAQRLDAAIARDARELHCSLISKWLMRLYRLYPPLMGH